MLRKKISKTEMYHLCEWDPVRGEPANYFDHGEWVEHLGCDNQSTLSVGANGKWHLCESCAALPEFKRYRKRVSLKRKG
jgi:hypothetical protein